MQKKNVFKSRKKFILILLISLLTLTAIAASIAVFAMQGKDVWIISTLSSAFSPDPEIIETGPVEGWTPIAKTARPDSFSRPDEMRAVYLRAGEDFYITGDETEEELMAQIDDAIALAQEKTMNTIVIDPMTDGRVLHPSSTFEEVEPPFEVVDYIARQGRSRGMYVYCIYYVLPDEITGQVDAEGKIDTELINRVHESADVFARRYELNGVLLDNYFLMDKADRYEGYLYSGAGAGFDNYIYDLSDTIFSGVVDIFSQIAPSMEIGLISEAVWANDRDREDGSATAAGFTMYHTGHCDVKNYIELGLVDFVAVRAFNTTTSQSEPYNAVMTWWSDITEQNAVPLYMIHAAHKVGTSEAGWDQYDQIPKQIIEAREHTNFSGSIFNSLTWLREDPQNSVTILLGMFGGTVRPSTILSELALTRPAQRTFTTTEPAISFTGASDPNVEVTLNGEPIDIDENGYFSITVDLDPGPNTYKFYNKGKTITYNIERKIVVLQPDSFGPLGTMEVDGGTQITISAVAYEDSTVYAEIAGTRVYLEPDEFQNNEDLSETAYQRYSGTYTVPDATDKEQNLGAIQLYGAWTWSGNTAVTYREQKTLGTIKVNKKLPIGGGRPIRVIADVCETFPTNVVNDISDPSYYPIPRGAIDIAVGNEILYNDGSTVHSYYVLASGVRVYSKDIEAYNEEPGGNRITGFTVSADSRYTTVTIRMADPVSYRATYDRDSFNIRFNYTTSVPGGGSLDSNPLFGSADWNGTTLSLQLLKRNVFMGYKAWYDNDGNLVLRFNNPPRSLSNATIIVDPGHGGRDPGATGFLAAYPEKVVNEMMASELTRVLQARGANVIKLNTYGPGMTMAERIRQARAANAHIYVSLHANSAVRSSGNGTEVYYFNDFSYDLANRASNSISSAMATTNRGAKWGLYYVTRDSQFTSVLCEVGFLSNQSDYYKMVNEGYQQAVGEGIANAISAYLQAITPASNATGSQSFGS